jgi:2-oxoglutarate dehydrogenase E2 component (dihydrolipoamide succinyltransferase)
MATVDLVMPKMGESIMEATILKWLKQPGDTVRMDETVLEIATDKVDSEVPSTEEGVIEELLYKENDVVPVGSVIARIKTNVTEAVTSSQPEAQIHPQEEADIFIQARPEAIATPTPTHTIVTAPVASNNGNRFYSPLVLNIASQEGVSLGELERIPGTGNEGRGVPARCRNPLVITRCVRKGKNDNRKQTFRLFNNNRQPYKAAT